MLILSIIHICQISLLPDLNSELPDLKSELPDLNYQISWPLLTVRS